MASNSSSQVLLVVVLIGFVGWSQGRKLSEILDQEGTDLQCVRKLIPCQPFLKEPAKAPEICCAPLKQLVAEDTKCLCSVFNDPDMMANFNVTLDDAMNLSKACDANVDICKKGADSPSTSPSSSPASNNRSSSPASNNSSSSSSPESSAKSAASFAPSLLPGSGVATLFMTLVITAL